MHQQSAIISTWKCKIVTILFALDTHDITNKTNYYAQNISAHTIFPPLSQLFNSVCLWFFPFIIIFFCFCTRHAILHVHIHTCHLIHDFFQIVYKINVFLFYTYFYYITNNFDLLVCYIFIVNFILYFYMNFCDEIRWFMSFIYTIDGMQTKSISQNAERCELVDLMWLLCAFTHFQMDDEWQINKRISNKTQTQHKSNAIQLSFFQCNSTGIVQLLVFRVSIHLILSPNSMLLFCQHLTTIKLYASLLYQYGDLRCVLAVLSVPCASIDCQF